MSQQTEKRIARLTASESVKFVPSLNPVIVVAVIPNEIQAFPRREYLGRRQSKAYF
jgi:hypothetical protein